MNWSQPLEGSPEKETVNTEFYKMESNVNHIDTRLERVEGKLDKVASFLRIMHEDMIDLKSNVRSTKGDVSRLKWLFGLSFPLVTAVFIYLFTRQDALNTQIIELLQQIANK